MPLLLQAIEAAQSVPDNVELVVSSPLRRCIETALPAIQAQQQWSQPHNDSTRFGGDLHGGGSRVGQQSTKRLAVLVHPDLQASSYARCD